MEISIGDIAEIALAVATTTSLIYIGAQVNVTRQQTKGQFLLALDEQFERVRAILLKVVNNTQFKPEGHEWAEVWRLMSIFERINIMVEDKIIDIEVVDRLHGFILMELVANDAIYNRLASSGAAWKDFIDLCNVMVKRKLGKSSHAQDKAFVERVASLSKEVRSDRPFETEPVNS